MHMVFNFHGDQIFMDFVRFLIHDNYEIKYAWCLRYNIFSTWFLDIRISTCFCIRLISENMKTSCMLVKAGTYAHACVIKLAYIYYTCAPLVSLGRI